MFLSTVPFVYYNYKRVAWTRGLSSRFMDEIDRFVQLLSEPLVEQPYSHSVTTKRLLVFYIFAYSYTYINTNTNKNQRIWGSLRSSDHIT